MKTFFRVLLALVAVISCLSISSCGGGSGSDTPPPPRADGYHVVVYSATPSGIMAAIEAADLGKKVLLLEPSQHVGGMTSGGLGFTDIYDARAIGGLASSFFNTVNTISGVSGGTGGTSYEPHVAEQAFEQMLASRSRITLLRGESLSSVAMSGTTIISITTSDGSIFEANEFIDASYEGDLMAATKSVTYTVGRESRSQYGEEFAGVTDLYSMNGIAVNPYVVEGNPGSGLLQHVQPNNLGPAGSGDQSVMAYNYRLCLSKDSSNQIPFAAPAGYDAMEFELLGRIVEALNSQGKPPSTLDFFLTLKPLPNNKFDVNTGQTMSTDDVGASAEYPEASPARRTEIAHEHKRYTQALLYFLTTDVRIPATLRGQLQALGLCKDEFTDNGGWPRQLYIREARRMVGPYVLKQQDAQIDTTKADPIGLAGWFAFDCHPTNRVDVSGVAMNEGRSYSLGGSPYQIPYRVITPQQSQATNLLVSVAVSASHVAYGSLRMEPTYMIMGQAAGAAASLAIDQKVDVQLVDYQSLRRTLLGHGAVLQ